MKTKIVYAINFSVVWSSNSVSFALQGDVWKKSTSMLSVSQENNVQLHRNAACGMAVEILL